MTDEEPGLLGNLPRSRPGTRSDKRAQTGGSKPAPKRSQAAKPGVKSTAAAKKQAPRKKPSAPKSKPAPAREEPVATSQSKPPATGPLESAVKVAGAGLRMAEGVTREVLRRLPRP